MALTRPCIHAKIPVLKGVDGERDPLLTVRESGHRLKAAYGGRDVRPLPSRAEEMPPRVPALGAQMSETQGGTVYFLHPWQKC